MVWFRLHLRLARTMFVRTFYVYETSYMKIIYFKVIFYRTDDNLILVNNFKLNLRY